MNVLVAIIEFLNNQAYTLLSQKYDKILMRAGCRKALPITKRIKQLITKDIVFNTIQNINVCTEREL